MKLPSGKEIYANCGIIGIDENLCVFGGYDEAVRCESDQRDEFDAEITPDLDRAGAVELADVMIARWQAFRAKNSTG